MTNRPTAEAAARLPRLQALSDQAAHQARLIARLYSRHARTLAELGRELAQLEPDLQPAAQPEAPAQEPPAPPTPQDPPDLKRAERKLLDAARAAGVWLHRLLREGLLAPTDGPAGPLYHAPTGRCRHCGRPRPPGAWTYAPEWICRACSEAAA